MENHFAKLAKINVNEHVEKKGKFSYLSWAWAVDVLRKEDPTATWEVIRFNGLPYMETKCGYFVEVAVTVQGITLSQIHPVLNNNNRPIENPNSFDINTSIQRCLVKAIALHGLGLYIYAGEDLPDVEGEEQTEEKKFHQEADKKQERSLLPDLKAKWQVLAGSLDGFDEFYAKQIEKYSEQQINAYLTKKMAAKKTEDEKKAKELTEGAKTVKDDDLPF